MLIFLMILGAIILLAIIVFIAKRICDMAIKGSMARKYAEIIFSSKPDSSMHEDKEKNRKWLQENTKEVEIISRDGLKLIGYERKIDNKENKWVIAVHGYLGHGYDMVEYIKKFEEYGYSSLIVDLRAHGKSEGTYIGMGWLDHYDLEIWLNKIVDENPGCKIVLYGISMGAAAVTMLTGEQLNENVKVCVADCGYSSVWDEFKMHLTKAFHIPAFPILYFANCISKLCAGYTFTEASSVKQVRKSNIPTLFIHGQKDKFVPFEMLDEIYKNANCKKQKLQIEDAAHAESSKVNPQEYWNSIEKFIEEYI